jgi:CheY-like chemotaxis protein
VLISVSDSGQGMTEEVMSRAFEPFFTTKGPSKGSGLGLSMVYGLMKQSRGHARILSRPGHGATLRLYLPRTLDLPDDPCADLRLDAAPGHGEHILMAEDDADLRLLVRGQLASLGYRVTAVANADEALQALSHEGDIRLLFTDIMMPGQRNGHALAREARRLYPDLKIVLTSGYAPENAGADGRANPELALLQKPYRMRDLAETIHTALTRD